ncbi:MAG: DNA primase [Dehalococcoidia bacterium]|nr:DNA primase [Dehalococcoidia bacterium]
MSAIDEIKQKTDIVEIIGQYTKLVRSGKALKGLCPFHSEKHGSFFVYPDQQSWHCFGACGTGGDVFSFIMKREGYDFTEAKKLLAERTGVVLAPESVGEKERKGKNDRLYRINEAAAEYYHQLLLVSPEAEKARQYLLKRRLNAASVENFKIGFAPLAREALIRHLSERGFDVGDMFEAGLAVSSEDKPRDLFHHRLLFPISDAKGRITGFGGRALDEVSLKYFNTPQTSVFDKKATLYGLSRAKDEAARLDLVVIVEGYLDVIIAHQYGFRNVVASMGTAISEIHSQTLRRITRNVVLALDADAAGEEAMARSAGLENVLGAELRVAILPAGRDPDEIIIAEAEAWPKLIAKAVPVVDFVFARASAPLDLKSAQGKSEAAEKLLPVVGQIKDAVRQAYYINKLAELTGVTSRQLALKLRAEQNPARPAKGGPASKKVALVTSPLEDYCLAVLLQHPELESQSRALRPEYFESTENREVLSLLHQNTETAKIKDMADSAIWERCEALLQKDFPTNNLEFKLSESVLRLREDYLRRLARHRALATEEDGQAIPGHEDMAVSQELRQVFLAKEKLGTERRKQ